MQNVSALCLGLQSDNLIYYSYVAWKDVESLKEHLKGEVCLPKILMKSCTVVDLASHIVAYCSCAACLQHRLQHRYLLPAWCHKLARSEAVVWGE